MIWHSSWRAPPQQPLGSWLVVVRVDLVEQIRRVAHGAYSMVRTRDVHRLRNERGGAHFAVVLADVHCVAMVKQLRLGVLLACLAAVADEASAEIVLDP